MRALKFLIVIVVIVGCSQKTTSVAMSSETCTENGTETHALCITTASTSKNKNSISKAYSIVDASGVVVIEGILDGGYVQWLNDTAIEIFQPPGMMPTEISKDEIIQIYDLTTNKMMTKAAYSTSTK